MFQKIFWLLALGGLIGFAYYSYQSSQVAPRSPYETAAIGSLKAIVNGQKQYRERYGDYAERIQQLGPPIASPKPDRNGAAVIPPDLSTGQRRNYRFLLRTYGTNFTVNADPLPNALAGLSHFFADQSGVIREDKAQPATAGSHEVR